jgi:hypothetical protein
MGTCWQPLDAFGSRGSRPSVGVGRLLSARWCNIAVALSLEDYALLPG